jgi:predicted RNA binding protein YcfA (HicA-like mRNA interferase family)
MTGLPLLKPMDVVKRLEKFGWKIARQKGSHIILTKDGHVATLSIPNHSEVARGTLRSLLTRAGISIESFLKS